jgi:hypothetical protein
MEEYFVDYNQALALKELGFDESCFGAYDTNQGGMWVLNPHHKLNCQFGKQNNACIAPLKQQVFRWFREKYGYWSYNKEATKVTCRFYIEKFDEKFFNSGLFGSYEEAESACIDKLIEIIKEKNSESKKHYSNPMFFVRFCINSISFNINYKINNYEYVRIIIVNNFLKISSKKFFYSK